jgi:hypothetical protein
MKKEGKYEVIGVGDNAGYWPGHSQYRTEVRASTREGAIRKAIREAEEGGVELLCVDKVRRIRRR